MWGVGVAACWLEVYNGLPGYTGGFEIKEAAIREQPTVLIISNQQIMQHLINRVCTDAGAKCITVASGHEAHALAAREDLRALALVVMALAAPNQDASRPTRAACQLLQEWTTASPLLPFVCIVPASQQYAFLRIRADILRVINIPVALPTLIKIIASSLPRTSARARGRSAIRDPETIANRGRFYGQSHGIHPMVGA